MATTGQPAASAEAVSPPQTLNANGKFEARFAAMEVLAGSTFVDLSLDQKESLWQRVKSSGAA